MEKVDNSTQKDKVDRRENLILSILVSIGLPLILCVSTPLEIFKNNFKEFKFSLVDFFPICLVLFVVLALILFTLLFFLPKKLSKIARYSLLALEFMFFLQGTYLNGNINSLSGDNLAGMNLSTLSTVINIVIWFLILATFFILAFFADKKGYIKMGCTIIVVIVLSTQLISMLSITISNSEIYKNKNDASSGQIQRVITTKGLTDLSSTNNILYFIVDRFDERYAKATYDKDNKVFDDLKGFTWYQNNLALYGHTFPGVASLLTNKEYDENETREQYLAKAYVGETPLKVLSDNGYKINLYTQEYYAYLNSSLPDYIDNHEEGKCQANEKLKIAIRMIQMSLYRCVPFFLKNISASFSTQVFDNYITYENNTGNLNYKTDNKFLWDFIHKTGFSTVEQKQFSVIHMEGCHNVDYNDEWQKTNDEEKNDITYSVRNSFKIINKYLDFLKEKKLYKDATIIITGDHARPINDYGDIDAEMVTALFFKPSGAGDEALGTSQAQVAQTNIWKSIFDSENITKTLDLQKGLTEIDETEEIVRKITWHTYERSKLTAYKYEVIGDANDFKNWKLVSSKNYNHGIMV